jgi:hypothetical protein
MQRQMERNAILGRPACVMLERLRVIMIGTDISVRDYLVLHGTLIGILEDYLQGPLPIAPPEELRAPSQGITDAHRRWLTMLDLCATPEALRLAIQKRAPLEETLIALLGFFLTQGRQVDHDRFDWLITYVFKRRLATGVLQGFGNIGAQILEMFPDLSQSQLSATTKEQIAQLVGALEEINSFTTLGQLTRSGLVSKGRELKEGFGEERYHPAVLAAVVNYNLVLGRAFRELFDEVAARNKELAAKLATADYRANVQPLRKLAAAAEPADAVVPATLVLPVDDKFKVVAPHELTSSEFAAASSVGSSVEGAPARIKDTMQGAVEKRRLLAALATLAGHFEVPENKANGTIEAAGVPVVFEDWEARALVTNYAETEKSFRAEFARALKDAGVLLYRVVEETELLRRKATFEHLRKQHEDSLAWLRNESQEQVRRMRQFAEDVGKRGLPEKQQQILLTGLRLADLLQGKRLRTTADPLGDGDDASLLTVPGDILSRKLL